VSETSIRSSRLAETGDLSDNILWNNLKGLKAMTLMLELAPEIEEVLREEAEKQGTTPELLAQKALRDRFAVRPDAQEGQSALDALKPFIGRFHSGKGNLSQNTGEQFAEIVVDKHRKQEPKG
jgi:hypothetical protein